MIRQLDAHLHLLGPTGRAGAMSAADLQARCTRPSTRSCVTPAGAPVRWSACRSAASRVIDGQHNLIYDNHKAARMRRRLPITTDTAEIIAAWQRRPHPAAHPVRRPRQWLFPSPLLRARQSRGHLTASCVGRAFKAWTRQIGDHRRRAARPRRHPAPFDPSLITPYALRHSYAQRHADAGVPVDVLKELWLRPRLQSNHAGLLLGSGHKRKQQAIRSVGSLAVDAAGNPTSFTSPTAYERASVSVPFGNCTEPSNVKAGGGACPIRFQCAGCGFYRPTRRTCPPSKQHIAALRADRETARAIGAADYVIANLTAEIDAFTRVADTMRRRLAELAPEQRAEVEAGQQDPASGPGRPQLSR